MNNVVRATLAEQVHSELRSRILGGQLPSGHRLLPEELAVDLSISQTPIKEALLRLEADGLVVSEQRRGSVVRLLVLFAFPLFAMLDTKNVVLASLAMSLGYGLGFGGMAGAQGAFLANLFPTRYRFSGIALARELNGTLIAGPTPFIASALVALSGGSPGLVAVYLIACCLLTVAAVCVIRNSGTNTGRR